jgi:hypothetical protein
MNIADHELSKAIDLLLKAKTLAGERDLVSLEDAAEYMRKVEDMVFGWAEGIEAEWAELEAEENARSDARFGVHNMAESERYM